MTTLKTKLLAYKKHCNTFFCNIDTLAKRYVDTLNIGESLLIVNQATGNSRQFNFAYQTKRYWVYQCNTPTFLRLVIYKGERYMGIPSPGIVVEPKPEQAISVVKTVPEHVLQMLSISKIEL